MSSPVRTAVAAGTAVQPFEPNAAKLRRSVWRLNRCLQGPRAQFDNSGRRSSRAKAGWLARSLAASNGARLATTNLQTTIFFAVSPKLLLLTAFSTTTQKMVRYASAQIAASNPEKCMSVFARENDANGYGRGRPTPRSRCQQDEQDRGTGCTEHGSMVHSCEWTLWTAETTWRCWSGGEKDVLLAFALGAGTCGCRKIVLQEGASY